MLDFFFTFADYLERRRRRRKEPWLLSNRVHVSIASGPYAWKTSQHLRRWKNFGGEDLQYFSSLGAKIYGGLTLSDVTKTFFLQALGTKESFLSTSGLGFCCVRGPYLHFCWAVRAPLILIFIPKCLSCGLRSVSHKWPVEVLNFIYWGVSFHTPTAKGYFGVEGICWILLLQEGAKR